MRDILKILLLLFILCFLFPSFIRLAGNFFEYLVFGEMTKTEFMKHFRQYSYGPIVDFYKELFYKLSH